MKTNTATFANVNRSGYGTISDGNLIELDEELNEFNSANVANEANGLNLALVDKTDEVYHSYVMTAQHREHLINEKDSYFIVGSLGIGLGVAALFAACYFNSLPMMGSCASLVMMGGISIGKSMGMESSLNLLKVSKGSL